MIMSSFSNRKIHLSFFRKKLEANMKNINNDCVMVEVYCCYNTYLNFKRLNSLKKLFIFHIFQLQPAVRACDHKVLFIHVECARI